MEVRDLVSRAQVAAMLQRELTDFEEESLESLAEILFTKAVRAQPDLLRLASVDPGYHLQVKAAFSPAIARHLRNPRGVTYEQEGGYAYSTTADRADKLLYFTEEEWDLLNNAPPGLINSFRAKWGNSEDYHTHDGCCDPFGHWVEVYE